jgi:hypothetical protein
MHANTTPAVAVETSLLARNAAMALELASRPRPTDRDRLILQAYERFFTTIWQQPNTKTKSNKAARKRIGHSQPPCSVESVASSLRITHRPPSFAGPTLSRIML